VPAITQTLILGGGISGLLAAWHLRAAGHQVEVWEASDAVGGWAQTLPWPGPDGAPGWLERGPQGLRCARGSALDRLLQDLELPLHPTPSKGHHWLGRGGHRVPSPATLEGLLRAPGLRLGARFRLLGEPLIAAGQDPEETLHAFMARRFGNAFAREWLPALVAGVFAAPPERVGLDALPRLRSLERRGGVLLGSLRAGPERTRHPVGGTGALAKTLAAQLGGVRLNQQALALEARPDGRWRVHGEGLSMDADQVMFALPPGACASLLGPLSPESIRRFQTIPMLNLTIWHSRHPQVPGWERGFSLLIHPQEGRGLLGVLGLPAADPRGRPGLLQVRCFLGGAYAVAPELRTWPGLEAELHRWLPELSPAVQVREETCTGAFPLLEPGHGARVAALAAALPRNLHWVGAARFGPGIAALAEGVAAWARDLAQA